MLFKEPSVLDLETAWSNSRDTFFSECWEDTKQTPAQWAWLLAGGVFWRNHPTGCTVAPTDSPSWWDWLCTRVSGPALVPLLKTMTTLNVPCSPSSLTVYLESYKRQKTGQSRAEVAHTINALASSSALAYEDAIGTSAIAVTCAISDPSMLRSLLDAFEAASIQWDVPNDAHQGYRPLHFAVANEWAGGVKELVKRGALLNAMTHFGKTAAELAAEAGWKTYKTAEREGLSPSTTTDLAMPAVETRVVKTSHVAVQLDFFS